MQRYLYLTRAMDYLTLPGPQRRAGEAFSGSRPGSAWLSFTSDGVPGPRNPSAGARAERLSARVSFDEIEDRSRPRRFPADVPEFSTIARAFLQSAGKARGLGNDGGEHEHPADLPLQGVHD